MTEKEKFTESAENYRINFLISEARILQAKLWNETDFQKYSHECVRNKCAEIEQTLGWAILKRMNVAEAFGKFDLTLDDNI